MSSIIHNILTNTMDFLNQINFSGIEYYEPVNMFDAYIVLPLDKCLSDSNFFIYGVFEKRGGRIKSHKMYQHRGQNLLIIQDNVLQSEC